VAVTVRVTTCAIWSRERSTRLAIVRSTAPLTTSDALAALFVGSGSAFEADAAATLVTVPRNDGSMVAVLATLARYRPPAR
jgi:hypothetical protein